MKSTYFVVLLLTCFACCQTTKQKPKVMKDSDYLVSDFNMNYCPSRLDTATQLYTIPSHEVVVNNFENHPFHDEILKTTNQKWLQLVHSKDPELTHSACVWLYFLKGGHITMFDYFYINEKSEKHKKYSLNYWDNNLNASE